MLRKIVLVALVAAATVAAALMVVPLGESAPEAAFSPEPAAESAPTDSAEEPGEWKRGTYPVRPRPTAPDEEVELESTPLERSDATPVL